MVLSDTSLLKVPTMVLSDTSLLKVLHLPPPPPVFWCVPNVCVGGQKSSGGLPPLWLYRFYPCRFYTSSVMVADGLMGLSSFAGPPPLRRASTVCWVMVAVSVVIIYTPPISVDSLLSSWTFLIG